MRCEHRQPTVLLVDLRDVRVVAREPHRHVVAEPEGRVVPAVEVDRANLEISPSGKLLADEAPHHVRSDVVLGHGAVLLQDKAPIRPDIEARTRPTRRHRHL